MGPPMGGGRTPQQPHGHPRRSGGNTPQGHRYPPQGGGGGGGGGGPSKSATDWARAAQMWASQSQQTRHDDPRASPRTPGGRTPGGRTPGRHTPGRHTPGRNTPGRYTPGGDATPLFDEL